MGNISSTSVAINSGIKSLELQPHTIRYVNTTITRPLRNELRTQQRIATLADKERKEKKEQDNLQNKAEVKSNTNDSTATTTTNNSSNAPDNTANPADLPSLRPVIIVEIQVVKGTLHNVWMAADEMLPSKKRYMWLHSIDPPPKRDKYAAYKLWGEFDEAALGRGGCRFYMWNVETALFKLKDYFITLQSKDTHVKVNINIYSTMLSPPKHKNKNQIAAIAAMSKQQEAIPKELKDVLDAKNASDKKSDEKKDEKLTLEEIKKKNEEEMKKNIEEELARKKQQDEERLEAERKAQEVEQKYDTPPLAPVVAPVQLDDDLFAPLSPSAAEHDAMSPSAADHDEQHDAPLHTLIDADDPLLGDLVQQPAPSNDEHDDLLGTPLIRPTSNNKNVLDQDSHDDLLGDAVAPQPTKRDLDDLLAEESTQQPPPPKRDLDDLLGESDVSVAPKRDLDELLGDEPSKPPAHQDIDDLLGDNNSNQAAAPKRDLDDLLGDTDNNNSSAAAPAAAAKRDLDDLLGDSTPPAEKRDLDSLLDESTATPAQAPKRDLDDLLGDTTPPQQPKRDLDDLLGDATPPPSKAQAHDALDDVAEPQAKPEKSRDLDDLLGDSSAVDASASFDIGAADSPPQPQPQPTDLDALLAAEGVEPPQNTSQANNDAAGGAQQNDEDFEI